MEILKNESNYKITLKKSHIKIKTENVKLEANGNYYSINKYINALVLINTIIVY